MTLNHVYTGKTGSISLFVPPSSPETDDTKKVATAYGAADSQQIGQVTNVEVHVRTDLEEFHELGRRHPVSLHPGDIHIGGSIDKAYINGGLLALLLGRGSASDAIAEPYVQPVFGLVIDLNDPAVPGDHAKLQLDGVKFANWSLSVPEDDFVMMNTTFKALTLHVIDSSVPAGGGAAVEAKPFAGS